MLKSGMTAASRARIGDIYQAADDPNTVSPVVFYDQEGRLWMIYGSYSGGIFVKEMGPADGACARAGVWEEAAWRRPS